jgi:hypothetical protein
MARSFLLANEMRSLKRKSVRESSPLYYSAPSSQPCAGGTEAAMMVPSQIPYMVDDVGLGKTQKTCKLYQRSANFEIISLLGYSHEKKSALDTLCQHSTRSRS